MQRQKSILSFFQKPSPAANSKTGNGSGRTEGFQNQEQQLCQIIEAEVQGKETPPEKVPRQVLPGSFTDSNNVSSLFSSIMHKFARIDDKQKPLPRSQANTAVVDTFARHIEFKELPKQETSVPHSKKANALSSIGIIDIESISDDVIGPETPVEHPLVPCLKRTQKDTSKFDNQDTDSLLNACKRVRFLLDSTPLSKSQGQGQTSESASKFEWLDPLLIRDAIGIRLSHPL